MGRVARTWLSVTVELVEGGGYRYWPRPGRVFAAGRKHTFAELATAIDVSFGRWDLSHQWQFELQGHIYVAPTDPEWDSDESDGILPETSRLSRLAVGDVFVYQFDAGDPWLHLCRVGETRIDPLEELGEHPPEPTAYDGWGACPTSTSAVSPKTTARRRCPSISATGTSRRCGRGGGLTPARSRMRPMAAAPLRESRKPVSGVVRGVGWR